MCVRGGGGHRKQRSRKGRKRKRKPLTKYRRKIDGQMDLERFSEERREAVKMSFHLKCIVFSLIYWRKDPFFCALV